MAKKDKKATCINCKHYDGENCHKNGNVGILVKYRQETKFFIEKAEKINANGDCKEYAKL